ncbi:MAG: hypothetical protein KDM63_10705, partial [Verrucomicrobiae bacterium]|nr:hypothetical protein [Verrucomicrobiae bacterium]
MAILVIFIDPELVVAKSFALLEKRFQSTGDRTPDFSKILNRRMEQLSPLVSFARATRKDLIEVAKKSVEVGGETGVRGHGRRFKGGVQMW